MAQSTMHRYFADDQIHTPFRWVFTDAPAREAAQPDATDLRKLAYQVSDGSVWVLAELSPVTWSPVGDPNLGTAARCDVGVEVGNVPQLVDLGEGKVGLPLSLLEQKNSAVVVKTFTTPGSHGFVIPEGTKAIFVVCVGGGGGGGGQWDRNGSGGGTSSFGDKLSATGGRGGGRRGSGAGGAGGSVSGATFYALRGEAGAPGTQRSGGAIPFFEYGAAGGYGTGGTGGKDDNNPGGGGGAGGYGVGLYVVMAGEAQQITVGHGGAPGDYGHAGRPGCVVLYLLR